MKQTEAAFTLMETLLTVAIVLAVSGVLVMASGVSMRGASQSVKAVSTAATLIRVDRHIRASTNAVHIPYWADSTPYLTNLSGELYRSKIGPYIKSIGTITAYRNATPRGIEVVYAVNNREARTVALFPSVPVMEKNQ
jgi:type II secretory pathway pseudopilin PulG